MIGFRLPAAHSIYLKGKTAMKLCFNTSAYGRHPLDYALKQIAGFGFWGVEMMAERPHAFPADFDAARRAETRKLLEDLKLHPISILSSDCHRDWGYDKMFEPSYINKDASIRAKRVELTKEVIDLAADLGCPCVQTGAGIIANGGFPLPRDAWNYLVACMEELADYGKSKNVRVSMEAEPSTVVETTIDMARLMKDVNSEWIGLTYDVGHVAVLGDDLIKSIDLLHEHIFNVHIEDICGRTHLHLIPGEGLGTLNLRRLLEEFKYVGYQGTVTCDLYSQVEDPNYAAQRSYAYLAPIFEELN